MLFFIRFFYIALLLIGVPLFFPRFEPGGRFMILAEAWLTAGLIWLLRRVLHRRFSKQLRALAGGVVFVAGMAIINRFFAGVELNPGGMVGAFLGVVGVELLLPGRIKDPEAVH